jgi:hypothetical protein
LLLSLAGWRFRLFSTSSVQRCAASLISSSR